VCPPPDKKLKNRLPVGKKRIKPALGSQNLAGVSRFLRNARFADKL
jgi:hypothetical protein